jgi:hypothetical protein
VIAFGCAINNADVFRKYGEPGIRRVAEPDSELFAFAPVESVGRTYNLVLDAAARCHDLEALALVHPQTEIVDPEFCAKIRAALSDPDVGIVGATGATGVTSIAWWEGRVVSAPAVHQYGEHGGGELPALSWTQCEPPPAEVEALDGQLLVLAPWVVRNLRFDEDRLLGHGFDLDFSLQVTATGRKLIVADIRLVHHRSLELVADLDVWVEAHIRMAEKWTGTLDEDSDDDAVWKVRARRAEARREAARSIAFSKALTLDARVLELERALAEKTSSPSWRVTAPLRTINRLRREAAQRRNGGAGSERSNGN